MLAFPTIWLALAIWGAIHPMYWFVTYMRETGTGLSGLIDAWYVNASTTGLTWDLTIAAITLTVWIVAETWVRKNWLALIAIPATFCIGVSCGLPLYVGAGAISMIGLFNIIGSLAAGELSQRWKRRELLVGIFAARAVLMTVFLLAEKTSLNVMIFSAIMGLLWLSTVPPSLALCARNWGLRWLATIFGMVFVSHQIGGFTGAFHVDFALDGLRCFLALEQKAQQALFGGGAQVGAGAEHHQHDGQQQPQQRHAVLGGVDETPVHVVGRAFEGGCQGTRGALLRRLRVGTHVSLLAGRQWRFRPLPFVGVAIGTSAGAAEAELALSGSVRVYPRVGKSWRMLGSNKYQVNDLNFVQENN